MLETCVPKQKAMIRYHDIAMLCAGTSSVNKARFPEEGAFPAQTLRAGRSDAIARQGSKVELETVDIVIISLFNEGKERCKCWCLVDHLVVHQVLLWPLSIGALDLAQTGVMRESFERRVRYAKCLLQQGQLFVHQLIEQGVRFRRNARGHVVRFRKQGKRQKICHGFPYSSACFDRGILSLAESLLDRERHEFLRLAWFIVFIQLANDAIRVERLRDFLVWNKNERTRFFFIL